MGKNKLSEKHKRAVRDWLCEGLENPEIKERLKARFDISLSDQSITYYRKKYADDIEASEEKAYQEALKLRWCRKSERLKGLNAQAQKMFEKMQEAPIATWPSHLHKEWRKTLHDIRDEKGDVTPEKHEITGEDGGPIETKEYGYGKALEEIEGEEGTLAGLAELDRSAAEGSADTGGSGESSD